VTTPASGPAAARERPPVLALVGPTAAGKSALAIAAAERLLAGGIAVEIVSMDSAMVYRGMDIGTDKPSAAELARVPHRLIDVADASETVTVARFQAMARRAVADLHAAGRLPLLVGGSGLYFRAVVDPLEFPGTDPAVRARLEADAEVAGAAAMYQRLQEVDPTAAAFVDPPNVRRTIRALEVYEVTGRPFSSFKTAWEPRRSIYDVTVAGLTWPRQELGARIDARVDAQIARGLVAEVEALVAAGMRRSLTSVQALGYAQVLAHLDGTVSLPGAVAEAKLRTRRFARRQESWFRADPRVGWFPSDPAGAAAHLEAAARRAARTARDQPDPAEAPERKGTAA
jgi:tRNA dimethylallyltransferase